MEFHVLTNNNNEWEKALLNFPLSHKDIYFLPQWYETWLEHEKATAQCIYIIIDGYHFMYPFLKSKILNFNLKNDFYDIQTAYGYGGILASERIIPNEVALKFNSLINDWLFENKIVAEFIRVHPLLDYFQRDAEYSLVRQNVYILITPDYIIPYKQARQNVSRAITSGATIAYDPKLEHLDEFITLYKETAQRLKMAEFYHFNNLYFFKFKELLSNYTTLIHIIYNNKYIGSGLYLLYGERATLHLVGYDIEYRHLRINDLLYYAAIKLSIEKSAKILNIGGGTTTSRDDTLLKFKKKYSTNYYDVVVGKNIINKEIYSTLIDQWSINFPHLTSKYDHYFLRYKKEK